MKSITRCLGLVLLFTAGVRGETLTSQNLAPSSFKGARQPQVAVSPVGEILVAFGQENTVYLTTSTNQGQSFSAPAKVAEVSGLTLGMRRGPRIAASAHRIVVLVPAAQLKSFVSDDDGKTWSSALNVSDRSSSAGEGLQNITALPDGSFYAVWLDSRSGGKQIEGSRLPAGSASWDDNVTIYKSPDKSVCECCHPSVVSDAQGKLTVMWRNSLHGNRDFYLAESTDGGRTFSAATKLGSGSWKLNACPMDGGSLTSTPAGIATIWRRENDVYLDHPGQPEFQLAQGQQPVIAQTNRGLLCVWQQEGGIVVAQDGGRTQIGTLPGEYPSLATSPDGKESYLVFDGDNNGMSTPQFAVLR